MVLCESFGTTEPLFCDVLESDDMTTQPTKNDLLVGFERENLPEHFKPYYFAKRQNLFANIQMFRALFDAFMLLDNILAREFDDMMKGVPPSRAFPVFLFVNAHAKMRIAFELAWSSCMPEAHSIVRDAVESVAHGHKLLSNPELIQVWLKKGEDETAKNAFNREFWDSKKDRLFDGLPDLFRLWKQFSESGSHTNIGSVTLRFVVEESEKHFGWRLNYTGVQPDMLLHFLFEMLLVFGVMEEVFFKDCENRLKLDIDLAKMRGKFQRDRESVRKQIIQLIERERKSVLSAEPNSRTP